MEKVNDFEIKIFVLKAGFTSERLKSRLKRPTLSSSTALTIIYKSIANLRIPPQSEHVLVCAINSNLSLKVPSRLGYRICGLAHTAGAGFHLCKN
jgi:hypothetical protein